MIDFLKKLRSKFYFLLICISDIPMIIRLYIVGFLNNLHLLFFLWRRNKILKGKTLDQHINNSMLDRILDDHATKDYTVGDGSKINDYVHHMDRKYLNLPGDYRVTGNSGIGLYVEQISKDALRTENFGIALYAPESYKVGDDSGIKLYVDQISKDAHITDEERSRKFRNLEITQQVLKYKIDNGRRPL